MPHYAIQKFYINFLFGYYYLKNIKIGRDFTYVLFDKIECKKINLIYIYVQRDKSQFIYFFKFALSIYKECDGGLVVLI